MSHQLFKEFCQKVAHVTSTHIPLAMVNYMDLPNFKELEKCKPTMYTERKELDICNYQPILWSLNIRFALLTKQHILNLSSKGNNPKVPANHSKIYKVQDPWVLYNGVYIRSWHGPYSRNL